MAIRDLDLPQYSDEYVETVLCTDWLQYEDPELFGEHRPRGGCCAVCGELWPCQAASERAEQLREYVYEY